VSDTNRKGQDETTHQCAEPAEPQDPRDTVPTVVGRVFVLVAPIDDLEDETGNKRNLANTRLVTWIAEGGVEQ